jgi:outer membrane protein
MKSKLTGMLKLTLLFMVTAEIVTAQSKPLDVKTAIHMALANNSSLRSDSLDISVADYKNRELAGSYRPQVKYSSGMEYNPAIPSQMVPGSLTGQPSKELVPVQFGTKYNLKSGIEATQTIYRKDLLIQIKSAGLNTLIAKTKYNLSKEELVYQVASTFYSLQTNAEMIRTTRHDYLNMKEVLSIAKAQYENGLLKRIDYESLEINVANTESQLNKLLTQYNDQLAYFNYLTGLPASAETFISDSISSDLASPLKGNNLALREDLRLSRQMVESKEVELKSIRAEKLPVISSYFRYYYQSQFDEPGKAFNEDYLTKASTLGLSVSVPILDGSRRKSRISTATIQLEQLKLQSRQQEEKAEMELFSAKGTFGNKQQQYSITKKNLELASKVFETRKALYTEGVTTLMELLDAESELSQARNHYMQALIDVQTGRLDLHRANGTLLTEFLKSI